MKDNSYFWETVNAHVAPGEVVLSLPDHNAPGIRICALKWNEHCTALSLLGRLNRVTADSLDLEPEKIDRSNFPSKMIRDLSPTQRADLRAIWEARIVAALTTKYFVSASALLAEGLKNDELIFYYFLVGRTTSAEMGHADTVHLICVNARKQLVAKDAKQYASVYPLYFVDQIDQLEDILF